jgi:hypothetical protein
MRGERAHDGTRSAIAKTMFERSTKGRGAPEAEILAASRVGCPRNRFLTPATRGRTTGSTVSTPTNKDLDSANKVAPTTNKRRTRSTSGTLDVLSS